MTVLKQHKMEFQITFRWYKDDAYEEMNDKDLDEMANQFIKDQLNKVTTCADIRKMALKLRRENANRSIKILSDFMKGEFCGKPRYVLYIQDIVEYGIYGEHHDIDPSKTQSFLDGIRILNDDSYGFTVGFTIPEDSIIEDYTREDYLEELKSFKETLADGMWEGMPGSVAVHHSLAVVTYTYW